MTTDKEKGVVLTLYEFPDKICAPNVINWNASKKRLLTHDVSAQFVGGYFIEPGSEPHESEALRLEKGKLYGVSVNIFADNEQIGDSKYIYIKK